MVTSAPLWLLPITVSISKSQNTKNRCPVLGRRLMIYENDYMVFTYFSFQFTYASSFSQPFTALSQIPQPVALSVVLPFGRLWLKNHEQGPLGWFWKKEHG